jgi:hypothetical protein
MSNPGAGRGCNYNKFAPPIATMEGRQGNCLNPTQNLSDSLYEFWHFVWQNQKKEIGNQKFDNDEERDYFEHKIK